MDELTQKRQYADKLIRSHAQNVALANHLVSNGYKVPQAVIDQIRTAETFAQAHYHPADVQEMMRQSNQQQVRIGHSLDTQYREHQQGLVSEAADRGARKLTENMYPGGLDAEQFRKVRDGENFKIPSKKPRFDKKAIERTLLKGTNKTFEQRVKELDHLQEIKRSLGAGRTDEEYQRFLKKYDATPEQVDVWEKHGLSLSMLQREAENHKDDPDFDEFEPSDDERRRAQIADAYMSHNEVVPVDEIIHPAIRNESYVDEGGEERPTMQGQIAAAWETVEAGNGYEQRGQ